MNHHDAEISDVVIVLDCKGQDAADGVLSRLKELGLDVSNVDPEEGVIEGTIDASRVADLKSVPGVCYIRSVFNYTADYPPGDPRDTDGPEPTYEDED